VRITDGIHRLGWERGVPVSVHELDAALARGEVPNPAKGDGPVRTLPLLRFLLLGMRKGPPRTARAGAGHGPAGRVAGDRRGSVRGGRGSPTYGLATNHFP
jgi:hypothetical protein